jgi:hypothetical protein
MTPVLITGLIAMWGIVLGFTWLNRKDAGDEARSVDRFDAAMRSLSGRGPKPDQRYVVMPRRDARGATVDNDPRNRVPSSRAALVARRRRAMGVLAGATLFALLLSMLGAVSVLLAWLFGALLAAYVFHLRVQAKRAAELRARRRAVPVPGQRSPARAQVEAPAAAPRHAPAGSWETVSAPPADVIASGRDEAWEPTPVPLPTYVSKPVVPSPTGAVRRLDLSSLSAKAPEPRASEPLLDDRSALTDDTAELEAIIERRRAVGH